MLLLLLLLFKGSDLLQVSNLYAGMMKNHSKIFLAQ